MNVDGQMNVEDLRSFEEQLLVPALVEDQPAFVLRRAGAARTLTCATRLGRAWQWGSDVHRAESEAHP